MTWLQTPEDAGELAALASRLTRPEDLWRLAGEQMWLVEEIARRGDITSPRIDTTRAWVYGVQQDILCRVTWPGHEDNGERLWRSHANNAVPWMPAFIRDPLPPRGE